MSVLFLARDKLRSLYSTIGSLTSETSPSAQPLQEVGVRVKAVQKTPAHASIAASSAWVLPAFRCSLSF